MDYVRLSAATEHCTKTLQVPGEGDLILVALGEHLCKAILPMCDPFPCG